MGSFKRDGRDQGPDRRRGDKGQRRRGFPSLESLEGRVMLTGGNGWKPTTTNLSDVQNGPMAPMGTQLIGVYQAYLKNGGNTSQLAASYPLLVFQGNSVSIGVTSNNSGNFNTFVSTLRQLGMNVLDANAAYGRVSGLAPISALPVIAQLPQTLAASPNYKPILGVNDYQGVADNEALGGLNIDAARAQTGLTGAGVTVGVISDSANKFAGGLSDSIKTGDLPATNVSILKDGPDGSTDEGRAMMENIHDIAPGSGLAFAANSTDGSGDPVQFADSINLLANKGGSKVIVDDVSILDDPYFQDGIIAQAIDNVTANNNVAYFSAAANFAAGSGYLSTFRGTNATVGSIGTGRFMNFAPSGAAVTQLPFSIGTDSANQTLVFQYDQPFKTQEPVGSANDVQSQVNFYVLDTSGNIVASGNSNNLATHEPIQVVTIPNPGNYTVAIQVVSGPDPAHVEFTRFSEGPDDSVVVSQQFGNAGGTFYPSSAGHNAAPNTIGIGAVPWWAPAPYLNQNPLKTEEFSSTGPSLNLRNPDGSLKAGAVTPTLNPTVSGPDGGNTSFFFPGEVIDTSNPPNQGEPATKTNLSQPNLPSFFGTSSASPNVAAVAALMKQRSPILTSAQIRAGLIAGAQPLNGTPPGAWNAQGGFGMVNAVSALAAIDVLRVASVNPGSGSTLTQAANQIVVTFNRPVNFSTLTAADLTFLSVPATARNVVALAPVAIDDPKNPTVVAFPFTFTAAPNQLANGTFSYAIKSPAAGVQVLSTDGKPLQPFNGTFTLADTTPPRVANTSVNGRVITVQFSEPVNPSSVTPSTLFVLHKDQFGTVTNLDADPRFKLTYNPATNTATLDFSGLNQTQLGAGAYYLFALAGDTNYQGVVEQSITDLVGNRLDGEFAGTFPSGNGKPGGDFFENLGTLAVAAPVITSLKLLPQYDTGIPGDENTNVTMPVFIGQVYEPFPGTQANLTVLAEFNGLHGGGVNLVTQGGRGYTGTFDVQVTTNADGSFVLPAPFLPEGFNQVRLVVIGQPDSPPLPGLSTQFDHAFRIDETPPTVVSATLTPGSKPLPLGTGSTAVGALTNVSLDVVDPANPPSGPLATPASVLFPAVNPTTAENVSNYSLINLDDPTDPDKSRFIASATFTPTGANFVAAPNRTSAATPYFGRIDLTFSPGLNKGRYQLIVHTKEQSFSGITDAAGNPLDDTSVPGEGTKDFVVNFNIQPEPVFITSVSANAANAQGNSLLPRSYYEINPRAGDIASAPPTAFNIDFSNPLDPSLSYTDAVQLIRSADAAGGTADGDFGTLGQAGLGSSGTGFSRFDPAGTTVSLTDGPNGANTRLVLQLPAGTVLPADNYRFYLPNTGPNVVKDIYGNQLDGEFLGNPAATGLDSNLNPAYEDLLPNGQYRQGMSGDGVAGGAFETGFTVVPSGNLIYAKPDYVENPLNPSSLANGSISQPYPVLAPQAAPTVANQGNLNSPSNFGAFDPTYDRAGSGHFDLSAFFAAKQLSSRGPVVIVALPGTPQRDPITGVVNQATFVLQAPAGSDPVANEGSGSVPYDTTLVFNAGSTLKLQNASLYVQNQGSALQALGGVNPNDRVTFTSYADDTVGGDTNHNGANTVARPGDWGGVVFRNFDQAAAGRTDTFPVDVTLAGPNNQKAVSGADDAMSILNFATVRYGGGVVPATQRNPYDEVTLYSSRPAITNDDINTASHATISGDLDSFREDDLGRGPLIRRTTVANASITGIWVRPLANTGVVEETNNVPYADNPVTLGGVQNYTFDDPLPYILTSVLDVGEQSIADTPGTVNLVRNRLYVQPGMMIKSEPGAGIRVQSPGSSMIVGDRTYIAGWDAQATLGFDGLPTSPYAPLNPDGTPNPNFRANTVGDAQVVFTSALDNTATTSFFDPTTQQTTVIVPAIDSLNSGGAGQPLAGNVPDASRWGDILYLSGSYGTFDEANVRFGGGNLNIPGGTITTRGVLDFTGAGGGFFTFIPGSGFVFNQTDMGTRVLVTNNLLTDNKDTPLEITPNGLLAGDTLRPLNSGSPFFRGNILQRNLGGNGMVVDGVVPNSREGGNSPTVDVNSLWASTDLTYIVRDTITMGGFFSFLTPPPTAKQLAPEPKPTLLLTIQSALAGTLLANGQSIPRPGESVIIKLDGRNNPAPSEAFTQTPNVVSEDSGGAGFVAGVDNGVDPTGDPLIDIGAFSQMRFLGIGGSNATGQQRVPVVITSIHDNTAGTTVRGVKMFTALDGDTTAPAAGDGGLIYFGGNELPNYNVLDPRAGSLIDNADIRYISRIEMQAGGIIQYNDLNASNSFDAPDDPYSTKGGAFPTLPNGQVNPLTFAVQQNGEHALMISNSNLSNFRDEGVNAHPGYNVIAGFTRSSFAGEPNLLFMVNDTISNMPVGVRFKGDPNADQNFPEPYEFLALNNTFYNDPIAVDLIAIQFAPGTPQTIAHIHFIAMDNIFDGSTTAVVQQVGMTQGSEMQYNLFFNDGPTILQGAAGPPIHAQPTNDNPVFGDPKFVDPANGNFQLQAGSAAIDAARSELTLDPDTQGAFVTTLLPVVNQTLDANGGIRNQTTRVPDFAQLDPNNPPTDTLQLPGSPTRGFIDEWVPTLPTDPQGIPGPTTVPGTWLYKPALIPPGTKGVPGGGQRDQLGNLRVDNPNQPNVGFGSEPFFDIGAFEYIQTFPPHVTAVAALVTDPTAPKGTAAINLYRVGGITGTNKAIQTINVQLDHSLDPNTVNGSTVLLEASGGDGIFGNNNSPNDKFYNLSGKVSFNPANNILTINVGAAGLVLNNDEYRLILLGTGTNVLRDPQGFALDGQNTPNDDPNGTQLPLPSGSGAPGSTFYDTFVVNTATPSIVLGSLKLDPSADSNIAGDLVTNINLPAFSGTVASTQQSAINPIAGQTVILDISTRGDGVFDRLNAGTAVTDASGNFLVTVGQDAAATGLVTNTGPLPDSPYNVGPDGKLRTADDSGYTWARVRIIDTAGNASDLPTDPVTQFAQNGTLTAAVLDTAPPVITAISPSANTVIQPTAGQVTFTFTTNKNLDPASLNANSILVTRAGPDGVLGTKDDVSVPIDSASITTRFLGGTRLGPEQVTFAVSGALPNDLYQVVLKGSGTNPITDVAGNPLNGGTDFSSNYDIFAASAAKVLYVGDPNTFATDPTATQGLRANPYPTIGAAMTAAAAGDVIAVLPGVYTEQVVLKPFIHMLSAAAASTDTAFHIGDALSTVIRAPAQTTSSTTPTLNATVTASNLPFVVGNETEVAGFTISSPLLIDPALGPIDPNSVGVEIDNSDVFLDRDYIVDSGIGVHVVTNVANAPTPRILDDGIVGNTIGLMLDDKTSPSLARPTPVINDTFAFNTFGMMALGTTGSQTLGDVINDIFWENNDPANGRAGTGIYASAPNKLVVRHDLFSGNGPSDTGPSDDAINVGNGFNPGSLTSTPDANGNYVGNPAFVAPRDPRPGSDGPASFFLDANFNLTSRSVAIDAADSSQAPSVDFLFHTRVKVPGRGFPGTGPADIGAFEYQPPTKTTTGGVTATGFQVATTSLAPSGGAVGGGAAVFSAAAPPSSITVTFSQDVNRATVTPSSLKLFGDGLNAASPARPVSVTWVDSRTAVFNLSGGFSSQGSVVVSIAAGSVQSTAGQGLPAFSDFFRIMPAVTPPTTSTGTAIHAASVQPAAPPQAASLTPAPAPPPQGPVARLKTLARPRRRR